MGSERRLVGGGVRRDEKGLGGLGRRQGLEAVGEVREPLDEDVDDQAVALEPASGPEQHDRERQPAGALRAAQHPARATR